MSVETEVCAQDFGELWQTQLSAGERSFIVDEAYAPGPEWDMRIMCNAKGTNGNLLDPFMDIKLHGHGEHSAMFWLFSRQSCESLLVDEGVTADITDPANRVCGSGESGSGESGSGAGRTTAPTS